MRVLSDPDALVLADEPRSFPALAACAVGEHCATGEADMLRQALAGGACISAASSVNNASPQLITAAELCDDENDVALSWSALQADPINARPAADASRRAFSTERRLAQNAIADLLDRVQRWS